MVVVNDVFGLAERALANGVSADGGDFEIFEPVVDFLFIRLKFEPILRREPARISHAAEGGKSPAPFVFNKISKPLCRFAFRKTSPVEIPPLRRKDGKLACFDEAAQAVEPFLKFLHRLQEADGTGDDPKTGLLILKAQAKERDGNPEEVLRPLVKLVEVPSR